MKASSRASRLIAAFLLPLAGCDNADTPPAASGPGAASPAQPVTGVAPKGPAPSADLPTFVDVAEQAGVAMMNHTGKPKDKDWIVSGMGGGAIAFDYDRDGRMDLLVVDGTMLTEEGVLQYDDEWRTRLFHNDGNMHFTDVTKQSGIDLKAFGFGGASCDYDGDGWPDVYICCWGKSHLYRNRGDGTFEDVTDKVGLGGHDEDMSTACCWGDVDGDGIPDLYVSNYIDQWEFIRKCRSAKPPIPGRSAKWRDLPVYVGPPGLTPQIDRLYLGTKDGKFREVTETNLVGQVGKDHPARYGFQPVMTDVDNDGDLDIYVANDTQANYLWLNDGHGVFHDVGLEAGCAVEFNSGQQASMGVDVADINRDGWLDIAVTNFSHDHLTTYLNQTGNNPRHAVSFVDASAQLGVARASFLRLQWGVRLLDYDNDGDLDLFVGCGHVYGEIDQFSQKTGTTYRQRCLLLHGEGAPTYRFDDVTDQGGSALQIQRVWRSAVFADFDNDGDLDVFVSALNDRAALFRNDGGNRNAFLVFRLVGKGRLVDPCGARVTCWFPDGKPHIEELHHGASFCSDNDPRLFFGCGSLKSIPKVDVLWPGGAKQTFKDVPTRKFFLVEQGKDALVEEKQP